MSNRCKEASTALSTFVLVCLLVGLEGAYPISEVAPSGPLYITIVSESSSVTLVTQSRGHSKTVGPFAKQWFSERFAQLYQILEERTSRDEELEALVGELSDTLIVPMESAIASCSEVIVLLPHGTLEIPFDLLSFDDTPLFLQRPVSYQLRRMDESAFKFDDPWSAFVVSDSTADPERAGHAVAKLFGNATYRRVREVTADSLHNQAREDVVVLSVHGVVGTSKPDHVQLDEGIALPHDFAALRPQLVYFDSCRLGVSREFVEAFREMGTQYYLAPIVSNEAGDSSTLTMKLFFQHLKAGKSPEIAMFLTRERLTQVYKGRNLAILYWKAFPFRVYRLN